MLKVKGNSELVTTMHRDMNSKLSIRQGTSEEPAESAAGG